MEAPRVGVGLLIRRDGELLLVLRRGTHGDGTWSTPGGNLEFGEDPAACAVREAREETGVEVGEPRFVGITNDVMADEGMHYVTLWYEADHEAGDGKPLAEYELAEARWFPEEDLPSPLFTPLRHLLAGEGTR